MEKIIDGVSYEFLPDSENKDALGCDGCAFNDCDCFSAGNDCLTLDGIWKLKTEPDGKDN